MLRASSFGLALLLVAGLAEAAEGSLRATSAEPVVLDGTLTALGEDASATLHAVLDGEAVLTGLVGTIHHVEWTRNTTRVEGVGRFVHPENDARETTYEVDGATLVVRYASERALWNVDAGASGKIAVSALLRAEGRPTLVGPVTPGDEGFSVPTPVTDGTRRPPASVAWECDEDDAFTGRYDGVSSAEGFPIASLAAFDLRGPVEVMIDAGNATFVDATGARHDLRLGTWATDEPLGAGGATRTAEHRSRLVFRGEAEGSSIPTGDNWALCADRLLWTVDGSLVLHGATGSYGPDGSPTRFEDARVAVSGRFDVDVSPAGVALGEDVYEARGDLASVVVDGRQLADPSSAGGRAAAALSWTAAAALLLALAGRFAGLLYTRIAPDDVLANSTRRAIFDAVTATPGIHLRELRRAVGGAWGAFNFHLRLLRATGHVRTAKDGQYLLVFPVAGPATLDRPRGLHHPVARAIWDALPPDGSAVELSEIRRRVGVSPELLRYHLRSLEDRGLAKRSRRPGERGRVAARAV